MRILLLSSAYNSLTQHAHVELMSRGHSVGVATATSAAGMRAAVDQFRPDLILCPMLAQVIPQDLWETYPFLILHPGIVGDRGGNSASPPSPPKQPVTTTPRVRPPGGAVPSV